MCFFVVIFLLVSKRTRHIYIYSFGNVSLDLCLFGAVAPMIATCLYYISQCCNAFSVARLMWLLLLVEFLLFSVFMIVNALFVDVSVGVVVVCNLRRFFFCLFPSLHFKPTVCNSVNDEKR